jgi:hypothetical protein
MRPSALALHVAVALSLLGAPAARGDDSTVVRPEAPAAPDSIRMAAPAGATAALRAAASDSVSPALALEALRKHGEGTLEEVLRGRRPVLLGLLPSFGPVTAAAVLPDAGSPVRPWPLGTVADHATDRTVISGMPLFFGVPDLATAWEGTDADGVESFDLLWLDRDLAPGPLRAAGDLLARPRAQSYASVAMPGGARAGKRARSALYYRKGDGGALDTGARFSSPLLARGIALSFTRHETDLVGPFLDALSSRYHAAAGLPRLGPFDAWVEGRVFEKRSEIAIPGGYAEYDAGDLGTGGFGTVRSRAEWAKKDLALHVRAAGERVDAAGSLRVGRATRTQVGYSGERERWAFPEVALDVSTAWSPPGDWTWTWSGEASSRRVDYRADSAASFRPRVGSARGALGLRRALGERLSAAAEVAADLREGEPTVVDGRLSIWGGGARAKIRLDVESAHERPSHVDLLTPFRRLDFADVLVLPKPVRYVREGNPRLRPRALRGALAAGSLALARGLTLQGSGSLRRVSHDFGWDGIRTETADTIYVNDVARARGDAWAAHAAIGCSVAAGPIRAHGLGWVRDAARAHTPRAGSPPRRGLDASLALRAVLFGGDLPLELGAEAHATGRREGLIRAPSLVTWDAALRADFGAAAVYFELTNVFDRDVPSAVYEISTDAGVPLPLRAFHFGVVWYLID